MTTGSDHLLAFDREHVWHPYTSVTDPTPVRLVESASGVRLRLADDTELVDGMSSWWAAIHGYAVPELDEFMPVRVLPSFRLKTKTTKTR